MHIYTPIYLQFYLYLYLYLFKIIYAHSSVSIFTNRHFFLINDQLNQITLTMQH